MGCLVGYGQGPGACAVDVSGQFRGQFEGHFRAETESNRAIPENLNAAFLIALCGQDHPDYSAARVYLDEKEKNPLWRTIAAFYKEGLELVVNEFQAFSSDPGSGERVERLKAKITGVGGRQDPKLQEELWTLFHPEAAGILNKKESRTLELRQRRKIRISALNPLPLSDVSREVLFTANVLLTTPPAWKRVEDLDISPGLREMVKEVAMEEQVFWYDHPVPVGIEPAMNEILYGLHNLSEAFLYEKEAGNAGRDSELTCVLSASVTHEGLKRVVKEYIEDEIKKARDLPGLVIHLFTEADTDRLIRDVLAPAADKFMDEIKDPASILREVVGVDGRYGRHYSFLKAVAAFWQVFIDPEKRATFKIDLDQVFPQKKLLEETGRTAFGHLMTPLWGADGMDFEGNPVHLGMIAGALVNESDIGASLFTPDVTYPCPPFRGEETVFCSRVPQALSTAAEMMARYTGPEMDGRAFCMQRVHVTGGTTGITIDALRKYRPFTPVFINRAEDQAYLLSLLSPPGPIRPSADDGALRYLHKDGLFMRHDKEAFAGEAIEAAAIGKIVGDYERILYFSYYARALPTDTGAIKRLIDPFTGSFVSPLPFTLAYLRLGLKAADLFSSGREEDALKGLELMKTGSRRLRAATRDILAGNGEALKDSYEREKAAWDLYYDILRRLEEAIEAGDPFAVDLKERAKKLVMETRVVVA
ncbi:MAG: hypothetical protein BMS9Abin23_0082 [Thermodesulfobacteriota bacterium]|nr:MAG: hypothetical protein BMS9Abin23_0082 [Thermodesulfobacteriota bacterium]